jgi:2,4-dienoyl-CoA reductase-like NADH-dependent reductase (Old Yellow Enzyme family)
MADIFSPWKIGHLELSNRLVRSDTWEGMADEAGAEEK